MKIQFNKHLNAILLALLVTFLWSTSFILIKWGLAEIPPLTYAGLRYTLAFLCLLPLAFTKKSKAAIKTLNRNEWLKLSLYGLLFIAFTQGAMFMGLQLLPAVTVSLWFEFYTNSCCCVSVLFFFANIQGFFNGEVQYYLLLEYWFISSRSH